MPCKLLLAALVVATVLQSVVCRDADCLDVGETAASSLAASLNTCLPVPGSKRLSMLMLTRFDSDSAVSIALFGTKASGIQQAAKYVEAAVLGAQGKILLRANAINHIDKGVLYNAVKASHELPGCARGVVRYDNMEQAGSDTLNTFLALMDTSRGHAKSPVGEPDLEANRLVVVLVFDMEDQDVDWKSPGWDWKRWVEDHYESRPQYTPLTFTGRVSEGWAVTADDEMMQALQQNPSCKGNWASNILSGGQSKLAVAGVAVVGLVALAVALRKRSSKPARGPALAGHQLHEAGTSPVQRRATRQPQPAQHGQGTAPAEYQRPKGE